MTVAVLGAGAFGTALAIALAQGGPVTLWARDPDAVRRMARDRESPRLPGCRLPDGVAPTAALDEAARADILCLSVPMQALGDLVRQLPPEAADRPLVACCKGLDLRSLTGSTAVIAEILPQARAAALTGPGFAADLARGRPTALTLACADPATGAALQQRLSVPTLRLYRSADPLGAELGGALKNVVAIACGVCDGLGFGDSSRSALMTRGFAEMRRLAAHLGADPATLAGLSGLGDLALTCHSDLSRNFRLGRALGRGDRADASQTTEGVATAEAVARLAARDGLDLPICAEVHRLTTGKTDAATALNALLSRPLKEE